MTEQRIRKIGANYIFIPEYPLTKNGYLVIDNNNITNIVDTGGIIKEFHGLEFYGGMIVDLRCKTIILQNIVGENIIKVLTDFYRSLSSATDGIAVLESADLKNMRFTALNRLKTLIDFSDL
ncbi:MAG: hypothetical protein LBM07_00560 [Culturomica sp.]|jgi:hypothetical protein|nr:hypothetical protein [Culturomica sp.]